MPYGPQINLPALPPAARQKSLSLGNIGSFSSLMYYRAGILC